MNSAKHFTNFISVWIISILTIILPVVIILSLGRYYKVEDFGNYAVAASFMGTVAIFLTFGLGNVVSFEIASVSDRSKSKISELMFSSFIALAIFSVVSVCIAGAALFLLKYNSQIVSLSLILGLGYWLIGANYVLGGVFMGIKEMHIPAISAFGILLSAVLSVFPCLYLHSSVWKIAAAWSLSQGIGSLITLFFLYQNGFIVRTRVTKRRVWLLIRRSLGIGFDSIISRLGANLTNILLPLYLTSYQIGIFNGALKPFMLLAIAGECCLRFFSPYIAGVRYESREKVQEYVLLAHKLVTFFTLTLLILPVFYAVPMLNIVFGNKLIESAPYMAILAFGYIVYYLPPQSPPLVALGLEWKVVWCSFARLILNIFGIILFIPKFGILGAIIALNISFVGYWLSTMLLYHTKRIRPITCFSRYIAFTAVVFVSGYAIRQLVSGGFSGVIIFLLVSYLFSLIIYWSKLEKQIAITYVRPLIEKLGFNRV